MKKKINILIIVALSMVSCIALLIINNIGNKNSGLTAKIYVENELILTIDLSVVFEEREYTINLENDEMTFLVGLNKIKVLDVDCPNLICKHEGYITYITEMIICAPNKVLVTLEEN